MQISRRSFILGAGATAASVVLSPATVVAAPQGGHGTYGPEEILEAGHRFFGSTSQGLAGAVQHLFQNYGEPAGYIVGEEGGGAFIAGLRYGEGMLNTKQAGTHKIYWQGPSLGWDVGADGARTMMLVYNLHSVDQVYRRLPGVNGSAYLVAGAGLSVYGNAPLVAPIRTGVGARLGVNLGYLKFTQHPTWNPF